MEMELREVIKNEAPPSDLFIPVLVGTIDPRNAATMLQLLGEKLPLELYGLRHLKRARKGEPDSEGNKRLELVLCPQSSERDISPDLREMFIGIETIQICKYRPQNRTEFKEWGENWPIIYRPTDISEERERGLPDLEIEIIRTHLSKLLNLNDPSSRPLCGLIVDPVSNEVITTSQAVIELLSHQFAPSAVSVAEHPLYSSSPTLLCVEGVAAVVRGDLASPASRNLTMDQQYVCTGLDMYLSHEPDIMSAMALVHSRIRRVIYRYSDPVCGALGSVYCLHEMRHLNHRFRVYTVREE